MSITFGVLIVFYWNVASCPNAFDPHPNNWTSSTFDSLTLLNSVVNFNCSFSPNMPRVSYKKLALNYSQHFASYLAILKYISTLTKPSFRQPLNHLSHRPFFYWWPHNLFQSEKVTCTCFYYFNVCKFIHFIPFKLVNMVVTLRMINQKELTLWLTNNSCLLWICFNI